MRLVMWISTETRGTSSQKGITQVLHSFILSKAVRLCFRWVKPICSFWESSDNSYLVAGEGETRRIEVPQAELEIATMYHSDISVTIASATYEIQSRLMTYGRQRPQASLVNLMYPTPPNLSSLPIQSSQPLRVV